jgi:hypothetical protein
VKIAELFISLGFKIEGREDFEAVARGLSEAASDAARLASNVDAAMARLRATSESAKVVGESTGKIIKHTDAANASVTNLGTAATQTSEALQNLSQQAAAVPPPMNKAQQAATNTNVVVAQTGVTMGRTTGTIKSAASAVSKLALLVNGINFALLATVNAAGRAGMGLRNFALNTGLSTDELQRWRHAGAVFGITAEGIQSAIEGLNETRAQFKLGEPQNVGAWQLLGVNPTQDPFEVVRKLRARLSSGALDAGVARNLLGRIGLEGLMPILRSTEAEFERWSKSFIVSPKQIDQLARFNAAWNSLKLSVTSAAEQLSVVLAPVLVRIARIAEGATERVARFARWLDSGSAAANITKHVLEGLLVVVLALGVGIAGLASALGLASAVISTASLAMAVLNPALLLGATAAVALVAGLAGLALLFDDFSTAAQGGKSYFDWSDGILFTVENVNKLAAAITFVIDKVTALNKAWHASPLGKAFDRVAAQQEAIRSQPTDDRFFWQIPSTQVSPAALTPSTTTNTSVRQEVNVDMKIDGARDPQAVARHAARSLNDEISAAYRSAPVPAR